MKRTWLFVSIILVLFFLSRLYIWTNRPLAFSEIIYSYMPYAHLWASGTKPYLQQWYEYPPATIPLFYIPHVVDMSTRFTQFHLNYLESYRLELLLIDVSIFGILLAALFKLQKKKVFIFVAACYYMLVTARAHDFLYDTMDLAFIAAVTFGVLAPVLFDKWKGKLFSWVGFFLGVALKYVNAPMAAIYFFIERKKLKQTLLLSFLGFLLVWAVPFFLYRSSILVSLVYQNIRGLQIDSAAAIVVRTANVFTKSEHVIEVYKNYEIAGPITNSALQVMKYFFPLSVAVFLLGSLYYLYKHSEQNKHWQMIHFTLGYIFLFCLTGKVLSTPFLIWQIPLLAVYPFKSLRTQLGFYFLSGLMIFTTMARTSNDLISVFPIPLLVGWIRTICFVLLFGWWIWLTIKREST